MIREVRAMVKELQKEVQILLARAMYNPPTPHLNDNNNNNNNTSTNNINNNSNKNNTNNNNNNNCNNNTNSNNNKGKETTTNKEKKETPPATKSYTAAAATPPAATPPGPHTNNGFNTVRYKKKPAAFLKPQYTTLNRQIMVETAGIPELITDDNILEVINKATTVQGITFLSATRTTSGTICLQTKPDTSADEGATRHLEIIGAFDNLRIKCINLYVNIGWTKWIIHAIPASIGSTNTHKTCSKMANEINHSIGITMAQFP